MTLLVLIVNIIVTTAIIIVVIMIINCGGWDLQTPDVRTRATSEIGSSQTHPSQEILFLKETVQDLKACFYLIFFFFCRFFGSCLTPCGWFIPISLNLSSSVA